MVFWTDEQGELHGLTLVTDLDENQAKRLSVSLGVSEDLLTGQTQLERVSNIVGNPALFSYSQALKNPAEYVLDKIIAIRGNSDIKLVQDDGSIEYRSVSQTGADIQGVGQLLSFSQAVEGYITRLKDNLFAGLIDLNNPNIQKRIATEVEETVLNIAVDHLGLSIRYPSSHHELSSNYSGLPIHHYEDNFRQAAAFLRTRAGCAGGGSMSSLRGSSLGSGSGFSGSSESIGGVCSKCGLSTADDHYHCEECPKKYASERNKSAQERTKQCSCGFKFGC